MGSLETQALMQAQALEKQQLSARVAELEAALLESAQTITRLQAQSVLLEERLRLTNDCTEKLTAENAQLNSNNVTLQHRATLLQQRLALASGGTSSSMHDGSDALGFLLHGGDEQRGVEGSGPGPPPLVNALSAFAASASLAPGASMDDEPVLPPLLPGSVGGGGGGSGSLLSHGLNCVLSASPLGTNHALHPAGSSAHGPHADGLGVLGGQLGLGRSPSSHVGGLNVSQRLTPSPLLGGAQQAQVQAQAARGVLPAPPVQPGPAGAPAPAGGSSSDFTRDAEVWPAPMRPNRSQSLLSARELTAAADAWLAGGAGVGGPYLSAAAAAAAAAAACSTSTATTSAGGAPPSSLLGGVQQPGAMAPPLPMRPSAGPSAPKPIQTHLHGRPLHGAHAGTGLASSSTTAAAAAAAAAAAGALSHSSWQAQMQALAVSMSASLGGLGGGGGTPLGLATLSPGSWEEGSLLAEQRQQQLQQLHAAAAAAAVAQHKVMDGTAFNGGAQPLLQQQQQQQQQQQHVLRGAAAATRQSDFTALLGGAGGVSTGGSAGDMRTMRGGRAPLGDGRPPLAANSSTVGCSDDTAGLALGPPLRRNGSRSGSRAMLREFSEAVPQPGAGVAAVSAAVPAVPAAVPVPVPGSACAAAAVADDRLSEAQLPPNSLKWDDNWSAEETAGGGEPTPAPLMPHGDNSSDDSGEDTQVQHHLLLSSASTTSGTGGTAPSCSSAPAATVMLRAHSSSAALAAPSGGGGGTGSSSSSGGGAPLSLARSNSSVLPAGAAASTHATVSAFATTTAAAAAAAAAAASATNGADGEGEGVPGSELDALAQNARLRSKADAQPNTCVYVGFLGWWVTERDLLEYFGPYGELMSVRLLISKKSRRSREQAFVEYADVAMAQRAITWLDGIDYPALVKQLGCGGLVVRFADRKKPPPPT